MFELDSIYEYEENNEIEFENGKTYIGSVFKPGKIRFCQFLLAVNVDIHIFFGFSFEAVNEYAFGYNHSVYFTKRLEIFQLNKVDDRLFVIIKTFWLRLFQRIWKKYYMEKMEWLRTVKTNPMKYLLNAQRQGYSTKCPKWQGSFIKSH